jgi:hypothetical protein
MFRTITARYAGKCRRCDGPISKGNRIRYGGRGLTYHLKSDCGADSEAPAPELVKRENEARARDRRARYGSTSEVSNVWQTSGGTFYTNKNGRCEDAPCCGCCS